MSPVTQIHIAIVAAVLSALSATAQNLSYGAANFYRSDNVTIWPVTFNTLYQTEVAGNLFLPDNVDPSSTSNQSALVIGHPMGAVKEQSANLYGTKMAEQGFVTLSLDLPHFGGSEGTPRQAVSPDLYSESFSAAVDYLGTLSFVDRSRIGGIGICGSGSFLISAAKIDPRFAAVATASMYDMGTVNRQGLRNAQDVEQRKEIIAAAALQRWAQLDGAEPEWAIGTPLEITNSSTVIDREFYDFYRTSRGEFTPAGGLPNTTTHRTLTTNTKFMNFYPFQDIDTISPRPLLIISGDQSHSREFSETAYERAGEPKELIWVPGAGHTDLYDRVELIPFARLDEFFRSNLGADYNEFGLEWSIRRAILLAGESGRRLHALYVKNIPLIGLKIVRKPALYIIDELTFNIVSLIRIDGPQQSLSSHFIYPLDSNIRGR
ncbi:hypothetical protein CBER1_06140 [Cercospora berteroae]|uniref:AB hydrolase-1 domain-containing protein n=1 Tax=Cercospora berteroae TaxID=357750 RepID=A0A2S6C3M7_9PEZI|nr:hypothetical protein CBER1_06140 [Cercospora berteroae]